VPKGLHKPVYRTIIVQFCLLKAAGSEESFRFRNPHLHYVLPGSYCSSARPLRIGISGSLISRAQITDRQQQRIPIVGTEFSRRLSSIDRRLVC